MEATGEQQPLELEPYFFLLSVSYMTCGVFRGHGFKTKSHPIDSAIVRFTASDHSIAITLMCSFIFLLLRSVFRLLLCSCNNNLFWRNLSTEQLNHEVNASVP